MNYIKHLNEVMDYMYKDESLNPTHISLYLALFREWNIQRFNKIIIINRGSLMLMSKIGSKSTYHKVIRDLMQKKYLIYLPSHSAYKGSRVKMSIFGTTEEQPADSGSTKSGQPRASSVPKSGQPLISETNLFKQEKKLNKKQPVSRNKVLDFFISKNFSADEGRKFLAHYRSRGWKTSDNRGIKDWRAVAVAWMDRSELFGTETFTPAADQFWDNLKTCKTKNYGQPL